MKSQLKMFVGLFIVVLCISFRSAEKINVEYEHLGRPCRKNHCDENHVCVRRNDFDFQFRCVPKLYFKTHPEKISEWNLDPKLIDELVDGSRCRSCLAEPLNYVCGTNGRMYRSTCFVEYFNCLFDLNIEIECLKECPCNETTADTPINIVDNDQFDESNDVLRDPLEEGSSDDPRGYFDECSRSVHRSLRNRFFDWFHQMKKTTNPMKPDDFSLSPRNNPLISIDECHPVVLEIFHRLDLTNDFELNDEELDQLEHMKNETCTETFFKRCDQRDDGRFFIDEWCQCFANALLPCEFHNVELEKNFFNRSFEGIFRPRCTRDGYFSSRQCDVETPRQCWCVNPHGIEIEQTRTLDDNLLDCDEWKGNEFY